MTPEYVIKGFETRATPKWFWQTGELRFGWRVIAQNGETILSSNQGHSRRIDRDTVATRFYERGCLPGIVRLEL